ncbi:MAG TPA: GGDEF domain-containing protein, partial [Burkholderiales bacterium]|nr:GGDEF domain-containing protein [Burkholderiales bacterium]
MNLDVRTIVVMLIVSSVLMTVTLAVGIRAGRGQGFARWNAGLATLALGWLLVAARGALPDLITLGVADALLLAGLCLQLAAVIELGGARPARWLPVAPALLLFALIVPVLEDYALFSLFVSASYCAAFIATGVAAARLRTPVGPARWALTGSYFATAGVLGLRAAIIVSDPSAYPGLFSGSAVHAAAFMMLFITTALGSLSFLLMLRERAEAEIRRLAMFDPLTSLYNRRAFMDLAERE